MAKIVARADRDDAKYKKGPDVSVIIRRSSEKQGWWRKNLLGGEGFEACAFLKSSTGGATTECAAGQNPRIAVGKALMLVGASMAQRKGAYKGLRRKRRRR